MADMERAKRIQRVLDDCLRRRAAGEPWSDADVIAEHAELMPELEERLGALKLIEQAGRQAEDGSSAAVSLPADHIQGQCPHCEVHWQIRVEHAGRRVKCKKCGEPFVADEGSSAVGVFGEAPLSQEPPSSIPGYEIESELGHGGMGRVYQARDLGTKRQVALKVMLDGRYADENHRRRFEREVEIAATLEHPNIARVYASGLHEGRHWFAMELVEGQRLDKYIAEKQLGIRDIISLFAPICEGGQPRPSARRDPPGSETRQRHGGRRGQSPCARFRSG